MIDMLIKGGPMMIPILLCSIIAFAIMLERFMYIRSISAGTRKFMGEIAYSLKRNRADEAIEMCDKSKGPLPKVLKAGILKYDRSKQEVKEAIEDAALHEIPKLEKNLGVLATIAQISPLLGFLGTAIGLAEIFRHIQVKSAVMSPVTPGDISGGVWQALISMVAGLLVAIPTVAAYNYFAGKMNFIIREMEISATDLVSILSEKKAE